jgi:hypothetical protein
VSTSKHFTEADRDACLPVIDSVLACSNNAMQHGVLALEKNILNQDNDFLTFAMMLIIDGTAPELVNGILETLINADNHTGYALLSRMIIKEGVLSIQAGEHPYLVELKLLSFLGERYLKQRGHFPYTKHEPSAQNENRLISLINKTQPSECHAFDKNMHDISDRDIQQMMKEVDQQQLAMVLKGCSVKTVKKLLSNISQRMASMVMVDMECMGQLEELEADKIIIAQKEMSEVLERLAETGEIMLNRPEGICGGSFVAER